jgi:hypothetical protein
MSTLKLPSEMTGVHPKCLQLKAMHFAVTSGVFADNQAFVEQLYNMARLCGVDLAHGKQRCWWGLGWRWHFVFSGHELPVRRFGGWVNWKLGS